MAFYSLLWATGEDRPGIVAAVTEILFKHGCNLEDSAMMRLGSEFGILLIFTSPKPLLHVKKIFSPLEEKFKLDVGLKKISSHQARFKPTVRIAYMVTVHGPDRPGIVYRVTACLAKHRFNITDLSTHRTTGRRPGFILLIEGEMLSHWNSRQLEKTLKKLQGSLRTKIKFQAVSSQPL